MEDSVTIAFKLASYIAGKLISENPTEQVVQGHIDSAVNACRNIEKENNYQATMNRVIADLSAAYYIHLRSIKSWMWGDHRKMSLFNQHKKSNCICLFIACIYHVLNNQNMVNEWLLNKMSPKGPCEDLGCDFFDYKELLGQKYQDFYNRNIIPSRETEYLIDCYERAAEAHMDADHAAGGPGF